MRYPVANRMYDSNQLVWALNDAIEEIIAKYESGELVENDRCYTVRWMKQLNL